PSVSSGLASAGRPKRSLNRRARRVCSPPRCGHVLSGGTFPKTDTQLWPFPHQDLPFGRRPDCGQLLAGYTGPMQLLALLASLGLDLGASRVEKRRGRGAAMSFALIYFVAA